jgi:DNA-binding LacI/PurR family transcriptional regulator
LSTIHDVAREAGVSTAAVSLVLNDPNTNRVGPEKKKQILRAVNRLSYAPNGVARALSKRFTKILGLVVPMRDAIFFNYFITGVLSGIQSVLIERGYHLMIYSHSARTGRMTRGQIVESRMVDGLIVINTRLCTASDMHTTITELKDAAIPFVMVNNYYGHDSINYVGVNDLQTGHQAAEYLLRKGRRRVAVLGGARKTPTGTALIESFCEAMKGAGALIEPGLVGYGEYDQPTVERITRAWLAGPHPPTAIFCADDQMTPDVYDAVRLERKQIPRDVAILGRGDFFFTTSLHPKLTTLRLPTLDIGRRAANMLIDTLTGKSHLPEQVLLPTELIERESV